MMESVTLCAWVCVRRRGVRVPHGNQSQENSKCSPIILFTLYCKDK